MKSLKKFIAIIALGGSLISNAFAAPVAPSYLAQAGGDADLLRPANVVLTNQSYDSYDDSYPDYWVTATYYPSGYSTGMYLGPMGFTTGQIVYPFSWPDTKVCLDIDYYDWNRTHVSYSCYYPGASVVLYYPNSLTKEKPASLKALVRVEQKK